MDVQIKLQHLGQAHEDGVISEWGEIWLLVSEVEDINVSPGVRVIHDVSPGVRVIHVLSKRKGPEGKNFPLRS